MNVDLVGEDNMQDTWTWMIIFFKKSNVKEKSK
jgi:hypothetical protein